MNTEKQFTVKTPSEFKEVINDLLKTESETLVIALEGDLGAGKTTFTQELGKTLGVSESVTSPTFTIMKQYSLDHTQYDTLVHIDAYRIESEDEIAPLHIEGLFQKPKTVICIEWPDNIKGIIPNNTIKISISIGEEEVRFITIGQFK